MVKETDKSIKKSTTVKKGSKNVGSDTGKKTVKKTTTKKAVKQETPKKVIKKKPRVIIDDGKVILDKKSKFKEKTIVMKPITDDVVLERSKKDVKQEKTKANNQFEIIVCIVVGIVFLALLFGAINSYIFIPAAMICFALELFCICYHLVDRPNRKTEVYTLFVVGVIFVVFAIIYTIVKTS